ncbi:hypothetical protein [Luteolibacter sp. Populi]|uniref:hypothetical protein n=1 Tax=Luteolibacter sp. Populi TaxID=3230487 RepID=UPI003466B794
MGRFFKKRILTDEILRSPAYLRERLKRSAGISVAVGIGVSLNGWRMGRSPVEMLLAALAISAAFFAIDGGLEHFIWSSRVRKWAKSNPLPSE